MTGDVLHRVMVDALMLAHPVDRHDIAVVQSHRRAGLEAKALDLNRVDAAMKREDLQGNAPAERFLDGLVDHAHAAVADLAEEPILTQAARREVAEPGAAID